MTKAQLLDEISSYELSEWECEYIIRDKERKAEEQKAKNKARGKGRGWRK